MIANRLTGGGLLADRLVRAGVRTIFSLAGAGHTHLLLPLQARGVRIVGTRHETGAVAAADGYARTTGDVGIAAIIAEQGLPNAITPIASAYQFGSPVIILVTRFPDTWMESANEFALDHHALLQPITKWVRTVPSAADLGLYFETARRIALSGKPGPVVLVIPQDWLSTPIEAPKVLEQASAPAVPAASPEALDAALALIAKAQRPTILMDSGCTGPEASAALAILSGKLGVPVFGYGSARGVIRESDEHGVLPWPFAQRSLPESDLILVAGARLNLWFGFGRAPRFPASLSVIQIDVEAEAIGRNQPVALGVVADPGKALGQIAGALMKAGTKPWSRAWLDKALEPRRAAIAETLSQTRNTIHALTLVSALQAARPAGGLYINDGADILNWSHAAIRIDRPRGYIDHHPFGSMGICLPMAIGAAAAERDMAATEGREPIPTVLLTGDGSIGFYIAELDTAAREALPLKVIIGNDAQWGTEYHGQTLMTGQSVNTRLAVNNYAAIARGFGLTGTMVDDPASLGNALDELFGADGPGLLDVRIDRDAGMTLKTNPSLSFLIFSDLAPPID
jgi:acetolactate synthase-1/2/3 large subunit